MVAVSRVHEPLNQFSTDELVALTTATKDIQVSQLGMEDSRHRHTRLSNISSNIPASILGENGGHTHLVHHYINCQHNSPLIRIEQESNLPELPPALPPIIVTLPGSPPNALIFLCTHPNAAL